MRNDRKIKILSIVALVLAITGMSLGFAAFSSTLTISSSATVTPNSDDFKIKVYGIDTIEKMETFLIEWVENNNVLENLWSDTNTLAFIPDGYKDSTSASLATIDNSTLSISNMNVSFSKPIGDEVIQYIFFIKNEGQYTAYLDKEEMLNRASAANYSCEVLDDEYATDTQFVCDYLGIGFQFISSDFSSIEDVVSISPGDFIAIVYEWGYSNLYADSPVVVKFENLAFPFTTKPQS